MQSITTDFNGSTYQLEQYKLNYRANIPLYVLLDPDLGITEIRLYGLIEQMESCMSDIYITKRKIATILGLSHDSKRISQVVRKLKQKNYLVRSRRVVTINNQLVTLYCWNTVKQKVIFEGVELLPPPEKNEAKGVEKLPPQGVEKLPPCNTQDVNKNHIYKKSGKNLTIPPKNTIDPTYEYPETLYPQPAPKTPVAVSSKSLNKEQLLSNNPHEIPEDMIEEWLDARKYKRIAVTKRVWASLTKELGLCGDPIKSFEEMLIRGWNSFKADWLKPINKSEEIDFHSMGWSKGIEFDLF